MTGEQLAHWRNYHQLTQVQLASMLGVHPVTVAKWEGNTYAIPAFLGLALETIQRELPRAHKQRIRRANPRSAA